MIARAIVLYFIFAFPIYLSIKFMAEAKMTREKAAKLVKTTGLVLISASLASMALLFIMLAEKLS